MKHLKKKIQWQITTVWMWSIRSSHILGQRYFEVKLLVFFRAVFSFCKILKVFLYPFYEGGSTPQPYLWEKTATVKLARNTQVIGIV